MSDLSSPLESSEFQSHARFVQGLARKLEKDESAAEDLVQDTWLAAVENPPEKRGSMRAWLARVLHNKSVQGVRSAKRREAREQSVVREEPAADTADLVERMELHRHVVEAVLELPEAYRAVLVRRFSLDESAGEIAAHLRLPEATVRTRLRRGLDKLRGRLRGEMGGTPALFLASLRKLTGDPGPLLPTPPDVPQATAPTLASTTTPLLLTIAMNKAVLLTSLGLAAVAVVWSVTGSESNPPQPPVEAMEVARTPEPLEAPEFLAEEPAPEAEPELAERAALEVPEVEEAGAAEAALEVESPTGEVVLRVEDVHGNPVSQATLHATQWRPEESPGSSIWWGEEEERYMGESGTDGVVRLRYTKKHAWGGEGTRTLKSVGFEVTHPDYITHTESGLDVSEGETTIVLERGSFLIVSGWKDSPGEVITDVKVHLSHDVDVTAGDWVPIGDGRPSCSRIPPGVHNLYLSYAGPDDSTWYSEVTRFELVQGEQLELALQLLPPRTMVGMVSEDVLRPITGGEVELNLYVDDGRAVMLRTYRQPIEADGSFQFEGLPPGEGEIIGMCDGWVSARTKLADSNWIEPTQEGEKRRWQAMWELQQLDPTQHEEEPYVLAMEPTAHAEITILDPDGNPVAGARVTSWPNIHWSIGYSSIFLDRTWAVTTDVDGVALLENMPGEGTTHVGIGTNEGYLMPLQEDGTSRGARMELAPGETTEVTFTLDPPEGSEGE